MEQKTVESCTSSFSLQLEGNKQEHAYIRSQVYFNMSEIERVDSPIDNDIYDY